GKLLFAAAEAVDFSLQFCDSLRRGVGHGFQRAGSSEDASLSNGGNTPRSQLCASRYESRVKRRPLIGRALERLPFRRIRGSRDLEGELLLGAHEAQQE